MASRKLCSIVNTEHSSFSESFVYDYGANVVHIESDEMVRNLSEWRRQKAKTTPSKNELKFAEYLGDVVKGSYRPQKFGEAVEEGARLLAGHDDLLNRLEETMDSVIAASDGKLKRPTIAQIAKKLDEYDSPAPKNLLASRSRTDKIDRIASENVPSPSGFGLTKEEVAQPTPPLAKKMLQEYDTTKEREQQNLNRYYRNIC